MTLITSQEYRNLSTTEQANYGRLGPGYNYYSYYEKTPGIVTAVQLIGLIGLFLVIAVLIL